VCAAFAIIKRALEKLETNYFTDWDKYDVNSNNNNNNDNNDNKIDNFNREDSIQTTSLLIAAL